LHRDRHGIGFVPGPRDSRLRVHLTLRLRRMLVARRIARVGPGLRLEVLLDCPDRIPEGRICFRQRDTIQHKTHGRNVKTLQRLCQLPQLRLGGHTGLDDHDRRIHKARQVLGLS
jgi:hypothetical protein